MVYLESTIRVTPGKTEEFLKVFTEEFAPVCAKLGRPIIAQWQTYIGGTMGEIVDLWAFDDLHAMQRFQDARMSSPEYVAALKKLGTMVAEEKMRMMYPTPLSKMK